MNANQGRLKLRKCDSTSLAKRFKRLAKHVSSVCLKHAGADSSVEWSDVQAQATRAYLPCLFQVA